MRGDELARTVTQKGQVTIPVRIRRLLRIEPHDRVTFHVEQDKVYLRVERDTLESAYGAVPPLKRPEDFQALRDQAMEDQVERTLEEMAPDHDVS